VTSRVRIVGAGLTGLAAAWRLTELGASVDVIEASLDPGGLLQTVKTPHGLVERAANAFVSSPTTLRLFHTLEIVPLSASTTSNRRFIFRDGRPKRWPLTPIESLTMASRGVRARLTGRLRPDGDESVASWSDRVWGRGATKWLISPALQGVYGAPADVLTAAAVFGPDGSRLPSGTRRPALIAPPGGMGELIERLVNWLRRRGVSFSFGTPIETLDPSVTTLVCTNATAAGRLVQPHAPRLAATLQSIPMTGLVTATAFFAPHPQDVHGFGVLFPRGAGVNALGVLFNADIFEGRSALRSETWISGLSDASAPTDDQIARDLTADREVLTGRRDPPIAIVSTRRPAALPVYGHAVAAAQDQLGELPGWLLLAGNYLGRLGVSKLVDVASEIAAAIDHRRTRDQLFNRR
jgi:protoporphyrinogen/coproporphyrinogen III oxidase